MAATKLLLQQLGVAMATNSARGRVGRDARRPEAAQQATKAVDGGRLEHRRQLGEVGQRAQRLCVEEETYEEEEGRKKKKKKRKRKEKKKKKKGKENRKNRRKKFQKKVHCEIHELHWQMMQVEQLIDHVSSSICPQDDLVSYKRYTVDVSDYYCIFYFLQRWKPEIQELKIQLEE